MYRMFIREVKVKHRPKRYSEHELNRIKNEQFHSWFAKYVSDYFSSKTKIYLAMIVTNILPLPKAGLKIER